MGCVVEREITKSRTSQDFKTIRARQAHYIQWCLSKNIKDPVGPQPGWELVVSYYIKFVMTGVNYNNLATLRSATCRGYAEDVSKLFVLRDFPSPVDFDDKTNWTTTLVNNLKKEEDIATQRLPLDDKIHAELINMRNKGNKDSAESVVSEIVSSGKSTGYRASEHSQKTQDKVDYHHYPSGKEIMKALNGNDIAFADKKGVLFQIKKKADIKRVHSVVITWRHQKNRRNGEKTRLIADHAHPDVCSVINLAKMAWRKARLRHSMKLPLTIFKNKSGEIKYMTHQKVTEIIRTAVKKVYPDMPKATLQKYSCHSIRVWACVCLDENHLISLKRD